MADNLQFPILFDLEKGVKNVISRSDIYLRQIEHAMNRKPIVLRAEVDASKFQMFSRQFTNSIDGISAKLAQAQRLWNAMTLDVKFDADGNLSRRAQVVFDAFQQLTQASATMGQRLGEVNRNLAKSEQDTARAITAEYDKRRQQVNEQIRLKERQAAAEERVRQAQLKGVNAGYVDTQRQVEAVRNLRLQYEAILPMLNAMAQRRYDIKVGIDKQFEADIQRINAEIARLRQSNLQLGAKGDINAIQANLQAIGQLEAELQRISQQKIDLLNSNKINSDLARLRTEISSVFDELQSAERRLASDNSLNDALDAQSQKVLKLHADIQKLDQQFAQLNATGKAYNQDGSFTAQANTLLQQRIALTKQLEQEAITGQQAQIKLEQQLREEKRQTEQAAKNAAKEAERQAKAEAAARKQAQDAANAENKARQEAYNARRRQGQETQRILNKEAKSIADITAKLQIQQQRLQSANIGSAKFNKIAEEVRRLTADLEKANQKMRELTGQAQSGAARQSAAVRQVTNEFKHYDGYVSRLIKRMAVYASFSAFGNFLTNVRDVTAQFELQRISLGAIIQDQARANQLFSEIKSFALKSPVSILDLTKYTKQLAAYKVGWDGVKTDTKELFDWTKKLTDVSVGLGVSMDRVVLAFGQVRATGYLRASEVRQFTEMGIPIVEELAAKLSKLNGEAVTAADVMNIISERGISFEMVKDVFDDMTSAGGMFYNMQEKQGNTLYGLWAKLGDAASVMYEQIGNTGIVNKGIKVGIQALTDLMRNWQQIPRMIAFVGAATLVYITRQKILKLETAKVAAIQETYNARMARTRILLSSSSRLTRAHGFALGVQARMLQMASTAAAAFGTSLTAIKSAIISTGWGALILALGYVADKLLFAKTNAERAAEAISKISEETATETAKSVRNFEYLANKAVNAPKGSKEQKEALEELNRTYSDILPKELLELEYLDKLNGKYGSLTNTIREYIAEQQRRKALDEITNVYGAEKQKYERELNNHFREQGWTEGEIARFWEKFYDVAKDKSKGLQQVVTESVISAGRDGFEDVFKLLQHQGWRSKVDKYTYNKIGLATFGGWLGGGIDNIDLLRDVVLEENQAIEQNIERHKAAATTTNEFADAQERAAQKIKKVRFVDSKGEAIDNDTYIGKQALKNFELKELTKILKDGFTKAELTWDQECGNFIAHINEKTPQLVTTINFDILSDKITKALDNEQLSEAKRNYLENLFDFVQQSKQRYDELVPSNPTVAAFQNKLAEIATSAGANLDSLSQYFMQSGEKIEDYAKRIGDAIKDLELRVQDMQQVNEMHRNGTGWALQGYSEEQIKKIQIRVAVLKELFPLLQGFTKTSGGGGTKSDNRLQNLQEIEQTLTKINQKYDELAKKEGQTKALEDINKLYANTLNYVNKLGKQFKLSFKMPTEFKNLQDYRKAILDVINTLKMKGYQKAALDLEEKIGTGNLDALQKDIEQQLKELADRISRTKTAKEFYEKILGMTGDVELAANVSLQIYGSTGKELSEQVKEQFRLAFATLDKPDVEVSAKIGDLIDKGRYEELRDYIALLPEAQRKAAEDLVKAQQQMSVKQYEQWLKDLEKAKDYADKRIELSRYTANQIAEIEERIAKLNPAASDYEQQKAMLEKLIAGYKSREDKMGSELEYEQFKNSALYVQVFENLENASKTALENMRNRLLALKDQWKNLSPEKVKELTKRLEELDAQTAQRNPFKSIADSIKKLRKMRMGGRTKEGDAQKAFDAEADRQAAKAKMLADEKAYEAAVKQYGAESDIAKAKRKIADDSAEAYRRAKQASDSAAENADEWEKVAEAINAANQKIDEYQQQINEALDGIRKMMEAFGASDEDMQFFNDVVGSLNEIVDAGQQGAEAYYSFMMGDFVGAATKGISAVGSLISGVTNLFYAGRVKRANKEIKRQQELLDQLDYTYGRLEKAADKLFGHEYLNNYNQQLKILQAQQQAYLKQAEAERSKGKKKDEDKIKEYENQARDTADKIIELQDDLASQIVGTDVASAARDFANAWLDAYLSFGSTTDAIKEKFDDMIKNMIVNMVLAQVVKRALEPIFKMIDELAKDGELSAADISKVMSRVPQTMQDINNGLSVGVEGLKAAGVDIDKLRKGSSEFSGIAKNVAGATSEEINNVAAIGNTLLYYASPIPRIDENLARIRAIMENGAAATATTSAASTGWTDWQQQAMDNYTAIQRNTADTVVECRRAANACEKFAKAIVQKGATAGLNVFLKN